MRTTDFKEWIQIGMVYHWQPHTTVAYSLDSSLAPESGAFFQLEP